MVEENSGAGTSSKCGWGKCIGACREGDDGNRLELLILSAEDDEHC